MSRYIKNSAFTEALKGFHDQHGAKGDDMSIESIDGMKTETVIELFKSLLGGFSQSSCSFRFRIGDIYNMLGNGDPDARNSALEKVRENFNEQERQNLRTCGWVASKWKDRKLRDGHGWTYYLNNDPNKPLKTPEKRKTVLTSVAGGTKVADGDLVVNCQDVSGRQFVAVVNKRELSVLIGAGSYVSVEDRSEYDAFADRDLVEA